MRLSAGTLLLGIFAVMFGLLGAYVVRKELHKPPVVVIPEPPVDKPGLITVPVASADLESGRKITLGDILIMKLNPAELKQQGFTESFMGNTKQIMGRIVRDGLKKGSTFDTSDFYPEGTGPSVSERLKPGLRAMTVVVEADAAVAGFAIPGSVVDVLFRAETAGQPDPDEPETTITLIEGAEVLAFNHDTVVGQRTDTKESPGGINNNRKASVTLAVTPRQATALRVVENRGSLALALRSADEQVGTDALAATIPRTLDDLLNRPKPDRFRMEVYRGRQMNSIEFKNAARTRNSGEALTGNSDAPAMPAAAPPAAGLPSASNFPAPRSILSLDDQSVSGIVAGNRGGSTSGNKAGTGNVTGNRPNVNNN